MPTKFQVNITKSAEKDFEGIWNYIAKDSPIMADRFVSELENQTSTLERFPLRCPLITENKLMGTQYRHLIYGKYRTIFRISGKKIYVLRIIHGSRLLDKVE